MDLDRLRESIDEIDNQILSLLKKRMALVRSVGEVKKKEGGKIYRPEREHAILERLKSLDKGEVGGRVIETIFREIFSASRNLQRSEIVAFLGPEGSFTHLAARKVFGAMAKYAPIESLDSLFKAVESGLTDYAVVPIENEIYGILGETVDLLEKYNVKIVSEIAISIHLVFASRCEEMNQIERIYSKDIAFQECKRFLQRYCPEDARFIPVASTSKGAWLADREEKSAAICSTEAATLYHLPILYRNIEDHRNNTRFVVLSDFENRPTGKDKTSLLANFSKSRKDLSRFFRRLTNAGITLIRIDALPVKSASPFSYKFYMELEGYSRDARIEPVIKEYGEKIQWLGSYPESV